MFANYLKVAIRIFVRHLTYTLTNVFGLAIGIAASIIIFLYVNRETSFDRFHEKADRIYRVGVRGEVADNEMNHAVTPPPLAGALIQEIPEVENATRVVRFGAWLVRYNDIQYNEDNLVFADTSLFSIFSFPLVEGDPTTVLRSPGSIVLSESAARRYFQDEDPLGKLLQIENDSTYYKVTGIMRDIPQNSHIHFDMVASISTFPELQFQNRWVSNYMYTYLLARKDADIRLLGQKLDQLVHRHVLPDYIRLLDSENITPGTSDFNVDFILQPITKIHLQSSFEIEFEPNGNILYVYLFSSLAIVILVISCLNFVNLSTARVTSRSKEISMRKIAGSDRKILIRQFLAESSILAIIAMVLALLMVELSLPAINNYIRLDLQLSQLINASGILLLVLLIIAVGILSGLYPAYYLASFDPVSLMQPAITNLRGRGVLRKSLVLFQFFVAIGSLAMTLIIFGQYRYMVNMDLGIDKDNLLVVRRPDGLKDQLVNYKDAISVYPGVVSVTNSTFIPGINSFPRIPFYLEGTPASENYTLDYVYVSGTFSETYGIDVLQGRFFDPLLPGDSAACVINAAAANFLGLDDPVGRNLISLSGNEEKNPYKIIGVLDNVYFETLDNPLRPLVMILMPGNFEGYLTVRLSPDNEDNAVGFLQREWEEYTDAYPFVSFYLEDSLEENYQSVNEAGRIFLIISITTLLVSSLGLYSLIAFGYGKRKYEIGVRKLMGAGIRKILSLQFRELLLLVLYSSVFAWAGAYFLATLWLRDIHYRITLSPMYFLISSLIVMLVLIATSGYQAFSAARANPGYALRQE